MSAVRYRKISSWKPIFEQDNPRHLPSVQSAAKGREAVLIDEPLREHSFRPSLANRRPHSQVTSGAYMDPSSFYRIGTTFFLVLSAFLAGILVFVEFGR